jgi:hypothetical protein
MEKEGVLAAVWRIPPSRKNRPRRERRCRRPRREERRAGARAPKKAPAFKSATTLPEAAARRVAEVERLKSFLKLVMELSGSLRLPYWRTMSHLASATTALGTPVSNPKRTEPILAVTETKIAPLCFVNVPIMPILMISVALTRD